MSSVLSPVKPGLPDGDLAYPIGGGGNAAALSPAPRPNFVRRETDQILSYYQSEHAGRSFDYATAADAPSSSASSSAFHHSRKGSTASSASDYSSHYSSEAEADQPPTATLPESQVSTPVRFPVALPEHPYSSHGRNASSSSYSSQQSAQTSARSSDVASAAQADTPGRTNAELPQEQPRARGDAARHSRRPSVPTEGGADRRRLAIVEMDAPAPSPTQQRSVGRKRSKGLESKASSSSMSGGSTLFSRRGVHIGGLALVAPPDASPKTYTDLTPPSTAPVAADRASHPPPSASSHYHAHARSASEAVGVGISGRDKHNTLSRARRLHHKSSRDVGIVGLSSASTASDSLGPASPASDDYHAYVHHEGLGVPLFQTPAKSRPPSPGGGATPDLSDTSSSSAYRHSPEQHLLATPIFGTEDGLMTPAIGEHKDIQQPVVGPVIVGLSPELMERTQQQLQQRRPASAAPQSFSHTPPSTQSPTSRSPPTSSSPYLHYQPGIHATAGPLPPPPRSIFDTATAPPPRPPRFHTPVPSNTNSTRRDIDAIREKLQLPQSVSAVLAARTPPEVNNKRLGHDPSPSRSDTRGSEESSYSQDNESSVKLVPSSSIHRREGAFPPSTILTSPPGQELVQSPVEREEQPTFPHMDNSPVVVIEQEHEEDAAAAADDLPPRERKDSDRRSGLELRRESSWVSLSQEGAEHKSSPNGKSAVLPNLPISRSTSSASSSSGSRSVSSSLPVPPPKHSRAGSDDEKQNSLAPSSFRATLTNLKRFSSLPRTPSRSSRSSKRSSSPDIRRSLSPSAAPIHVELPPRRPTPRPTRVSSWPQAMNARDVTILRSARERARAYAEKINELATYDCGLREWMASQSGPGYHPRTQSQRTAQQTLQPSVPAELGGMTTQARHISHGSLASQATFPIRADAYTATDLSTRPIDIVPSTSPPPSLPYPSLAQANITRTQTRTSTLLSSPTKTLAILPGAKSSGTGFFASLGRKTSVRREKGLSGLSSVVSPQSPTKGGVLTKRPPAVAASRSNPTSSSTRDAPLPVPPAIPGGPRAAPGRIQRSKTYSVAGASPPQTQSQSHSPPELSQIQTQAQAQQGSQRQSAVARRPSLFARARQGHASTSVGHAAPGMGALDPAFQQQVDKLAAILPHADRAILAGYLRRAGEDILAIGQYLEDEKNGTLRRD
ncbi:hypothetical protein C8Q77DRAFT_1070226 [Trametes polyzona]|nr:hypothetical protein C8Q77DRAFT_1070226 [Trametes polyzona]